MRKILIILAIVIGVIGLAIGGIWLLFNSGISNETSSTIDRAEMEVEMENIEEELNKLINQ